MQFEVFHSLYYDIYVYDFEETNIFLIYSLATSVIANNGFSSLEYPWQTFEEIET